MARKLFLPLAATLYVFSTATAAAAAAAAAAVPTDAVASVYAPVTVTEKGEGCADYTTKTSGLQVEMCQGPWIGEDGKEIVEDRKGESYRWIVGQVTNHNRDLGVCSVAFDLGKAELSPGFVMDPTSLPLASDNGKARQGGKEDGKLKKKKKQHGNWGELAPEGLWTFAFLVPAEGGARVDLTVGKMVVCEVKKEVAEGEEEEEEEEARVPAYEEGEEEEGEEREEKGGRGGGEEVDYVEGGREEEEDEEEKGVEDHDGGAVTYDEGMDKVAVSEGGMEERIIVMMAGEEKKKKEEEEEGLMRHALRKREGAARR